MLQELPGFAIPFDKTKLVNKDNNNQMVVSLEDVLALSQFDPNINRFITRISIPGYRSYKHLNPPSWPTQEMSDVEFPKLVEKIKKGEYLIHLYDDKGIFELELKY